MRRLETELDVERETELWVPVGNTKVQEKTERRNNRISNLFIVEINHNKQSCELLAWRMSCAKYNKSGGASGGGDDGGGGVVLYDRDSR